MVLFQEVPFLLTELVLNFLNDFLKRDSRTLSRVSLEVLNEVLVPTERKDVAEYYLQVLLIMLRSELLTILRVKVFHYISLLN
jgi:hypothetical protein